MTTQRASSIVSRKTPSVNASARPGVIGTPLPAALTAGAERLRESLRRTGEACGRTEQARDAGSDVDRGPDGWGFERP